MMWGVGEMDYHRVFMSLAQVGAFSLALWGGHAVVQFAKRVSTPGLLHGLPLVFPLVLFVMGRLVRVILVALLGAEAEAAPLGSFSRMLMTNELCLGAVVGVCVSFLIISRREAVNIDITVKTDERGTGATRVVIPAQPGTVQAAEKAISAALLAPVMLYTASGELLPPSGEPLLPAVGVKEEDSQPDAFGSVRVDLFVQKQDRPPNGLESMSGLDRSGDSDDADSDDGMTLGGAALRARQLGGNMKHIRASISGKVRGLLRHPRHEAWGLRNGQVVGIRAVVKIGMDGPRGGGAGGGGGAGANRQSVFLLGRREGYAVAQLPHISQHHARIRILRWDDATESAIAPEEGAPHQLADILQPTDPIVLECKGKFLSIFRGWWVAWNSPVPKRSGVFYLDPVDDNEAFAMDSATDAGAATTGAGAVGGGGGAGAAGTPISNHRQSVVGRAVYGARTPPPRSSTATMMMAAPGSAGAGGVAAALSDSGTPGTPRSAVSTPSGRPGHATMQATGGGASQAGSAPRFRLRAHKFPGFVLGVAKTADNSGSRYIGIQRQDLTGPAANAVAATHSAPKPTYMGAAGAGGAAVPSGWLNDCVFEISPAEDQGRAAAHRGSRTK